MTGTVMITGGLGYIGGRLAHHLAQTTSVSLRIGTRNLDTALPSWVKRENLIRLDLMSDEDLDSACRGTKCVIHLAALNEIDSAAEPERALLVNGVGALRLLRAAERAGVERFIYFSTAHVYGAPLAGTITEQTLPRSVHPYAISHRVAEDFVLAAHDRKALVGVVLRLSNSLGAPVRPEVNRWTLLGNDLCRQAVVAKELRLRSSGMQRRDFISLSDVGRAVMHFLDLPRVDCRDGLFNLGGGCSLRVIELAERIAHRCGEVLGYVPGIVKPQAAADEIDEPLLYKIDKLRATGFDLSGDLDGEIDATLRFCRSYFGGEAQ